MMALLSPKHPRQIYLHKRGIAAERVVDHIKNTEYRTYVERPLPLPIRDCFALPTSDVMYDVRDVANFTLEFADLRGLKLTNLALQKLLYFVNGWFFSIYDAPLIKNKFEAWQYGPVQRVIYDQFKSFGDSTIKDVRAMYIDAMTGEPVYKKPHIDPAHAEVIESVLEKYVRYTAGQLVQESHVEDGPWEYVWQQAEEAVYPGMKIPDALILDHFKRLTPILTFH
jgi:uncharacterized phage-associated protein